MQRSRSGYLSHVTRAIKAVEHGIEDESTSYVKFNMEKMERQYLRYATAHEECLERCDNEEELKVITDSHDALIEQCQSARLKASQWLELKNKEDDDDDTDDDEDSNQERNNALDNKDDSNDNDTPTKDERELQQLEKKFKELKVKQRIKELKQKLEEEENNVNQQPPATTQPEPTRQSTDIGLIQTLTDTLRAGFNLPSPELIKFNGDATKYGEFMHVFESSIESKKTKGGSCQQSVHKD